MGRCVRKYQWLYRIFFLYSLFDHVLAVSGENLASRFLFLSWDVVNWGIRFSGNNRFPTVCGPFFSCCLWRHQGCNYFVISGAFFFTYSMMPGDFLILFGSIFPCGSPNVLFRRASSQDRRSPFAVSWVTTRNEEEISPVLFGIWITWEMCARIIRRGGGISSVCYWESGCEMAESSAKVSKQHRMLAVFKFSCPFWNF